MKIAYIILAHQYPEQLIRMIYRLNTDETYFFIHIDKKTDNRIYNYVFTKFNNYPNIYFLKRYNSAWGSFGAIQATLEGIKEVVETGYDFDYVINLSGQDYLIKSNTRIKRIFQQNLGKEFIFYNKLPWQTWNEPTHGLGRIELWYINLFDKHYVFPTEYKFIFNLKSPINTIKIILFSFISIFLRKRRLFQNIELYGGTAYWNLTGECIKYINNYVKSNPWYVNRFKYTLCTDEIFFQTIVLNSPFKSNVINDDLRYMDWHNPNPSIPAILDKSYFNILLSDSNKLFARKFDITRDQEILSMIDEMILKNE